MFIFCITRQNLNTCNAVTLFYILGIKLHLLNREFNGHMVGPDHEDKDTLEDARARFTHGKLEWFG